MRLKKRIAALLMAGAMVCSTLPVSAWAVEYADTGGLCEHHPQHTAECGYTEGIPGMPCNHEHTDECYTEVKSCVHEHTEDCYPAESVSENTATPSEPEETEPTECTHECGEESGCITKTLDCKHEHDEACGYVPATEGTPCTFVCEICNAQDSGQPEDKPAENECVCTEPCTEDNINEDCPVCGAEDADLTVCKGEPAQEEGTQQHFTITGFEELPEAVREQSVTTGTAPEALDLPETLAASGYVGTQDNSEAEAITIEGVTWTAQPDYDLATPSEYNFTPELPDGYVLAESLELPVIMVTVLAADNALVPLAEVEEQFENVTPGATYWFDLSGAGIPGTVNGSLPDGSFHWVPFTYAGTVNAYKLEIAQATTEEYAKENTYDHSLFIADYAVTHTVSWDDLNGKNMIFGTDYQSGGVGYTLRAPSMGSSYTGSGDSRRGAPQNNEWDAILDKNSGYIKNWSGMSSWGQDTYLNDASGRVLRGYYSARSWIWSRSSRRSADLGFRPVLEILDPDTLGSDGLNVVAVDLNGGKIGAIEGTANIVVKSGAGFTAPSNDGLTRPDGNTDTYFAWLGSDGNTYTPGKNVPAGVTKLTAQWEKPPVEEQFDTITPGATYWFDLSGENIPGTVNTGNSDGAVSVPDTTLTWVPFTYAGTVNAYKLESAQAATEEYAKENAYDHSLFIADYAVTHTVSWDDLNAADKNMIFGKNYQSGGVDYTLRAPSMGSSYTDSGDSRRGAPQNNEWDAILDKNSGYIKNWSGMSSWGQDTYLNDASGRVLRGYYSARSWIWSRSSRRSADLGFRPVLEILDPDTLGSDGLNVVAVDLNGGKIGTTEGTVNIVVKSGAGFTAPSGEGLAAPGGKVFAGWIDDSGTVYETGDSVPSSVKKLAAQWVVPESTPEITINYTNETLTGFVDGASYTLNGESVSPGADGTLAIDSSWFGKSLSIVKKGDGSATSDSAPQTLSIPARPAAPAGLTAHKTSSGTANDGKITGLDSAKIYQYSTDGTNWTDVPTGSTEIVDLSAGTYQVRFAAVENTSFASAAAIVIVEKSTTPIEPKYVRYMVEHYIDNGNGYTLKETDYPAGEIGETVMATPKTYEGYTYNAEKSTASGELKAIKGKDDILTLKLYYDLTVFTVTVEINGNGSASATPVSATMGTEIKLTAAPDAGYHFEQWEVVSGNIKIENNSFAMPAENVTVKAIFDRNSSGGGSSGGGSSSGSDSTIIDRPDKDNPTTPTTAETKTVKADSKGSIVITKSMVSDAISAAQADARKNGNTANGIAVSVPVQIDKDLFGVQITLKADALDKLVSSGVKRFTIDADRMADFGFPLDTLKELNRQTTGDLILKIKTTAVSSQEAKTAIGSRPAYDITLWYVKDGKETQITSLNGKAVSVAIPYTPAKGESTGNLYAVCVDGSGKVQWLTKSSYNADQKAVIFEAQHFSVYGVGYKNPVPNFTDINGHWAKEHILFTVSRGLFSGTSETTFSPNTTLTRGMFVTALGRLAGINPADYQTGTFTDVKADAYYAPYVNWAASKGIVSGTTSTTFAPDSSITREQMAVILKNYADRMGYPIPKTLEAVTFADNGKISSWAKDAVQTMQMAGVLSGKTGNRFDPKGNATRAEAATVLHRFVEVIIDPQTANGWTQNDSGEWSYYKDGELVKGWLSDDQKWYWLDKTTGKMFSGGWKQIDGKWYYFYADGSMAVSTKVDGCEVGADGARITGA